MGHLLRKSSLQRTQCPRQESNLVLDLRRVACESGTLQGLNSIPPTVAFVDAARGQMVWRRSESHRGKQSGPVFESTAFQLELLPLLKRRPNARLLERSSPAVETRIWPANRCLCNVAQADAYQTNRIGRSTTLLTIHAMRSALAGPLRQPKIFPRAGNFLRTDTEFQIARTWPSQHHPNLSNANLTFHQYLAEESNLVLQLRRLPCYPAHSQGTSILQYPVLESNQVLELRRLPCDPLHHGPYITEPTTGFAPASTGLQDRRLSQSSHVGTARARGVEPRPPALETACSPRSTLV